MASGSSEEASATTYASPRLGKNDPDRRDHKELTWAAVRKLREVAQGVAREHDCEIYLVGSAMAKSKPRDIDIAAVWPLADFERRFGVTVPHGEDEATRFFGDLCHHKDYGDEWQAIIHPFVLAHMGAYAIDLKVAPDVWWADKPRLLLATP